QPLLEALSSRDGRVRQADWHVVGFWRCAWMCGAHRQCNLRITASSLDSLGSQLFFANAFVDCLLLFVIPVPQRGEYLQCAGWNGENHQNRSNEPGDRQNARQDVSYQVPHSFGLCQKTAINRISDRGCSLVPGDHSVRSACITSTRAARAAGSRDATTAEPRRTSADAIKGRALGFLRSKR